MTSPGVIELHTHSVEKDYYREYKEDPKKQNTERGYRCNLLQVEPQMKQRTDGV